MNYSIKYGDKKIFFNIIKSNRKTFAITISPDKTVEVKAPEDKNELEILEKVKKKAKWITKQLLFFNSLPLQMAQKKYISGETHKFLGKQYRLKIISNDQSMVKLDGGFINIYVSDKEDIKKIESLLINWYYEKAYTRFSDYLEECFEKFKSHQLNKPTLMIKEMKAKWGSCNHNKNITLNLNLIKLSPIYIKYVIYHEICHLKYYDHSNEFYKLLSRIMPDWKKIKNKLEQSEI